jgi:hypothetical protein
VGRRQRTEAPREGDVRVGVELLIAEEDDLVAIERLAHVGDDAVGQGRGEIETHDLGADAAGQLEDVEVG